ncbi:MAG: hypothetical protein ABL886_03070, partial [Rhodoglobus sp.]
MSRLAQRSLAPVVDRQRSLNGVLWLQVCGFIAGVVCIACFRSAPRAEDLRDAQITAGNWAWRLDAMRDDQRLAVFTLTNRFGPFVSLDEAKAIEGEVARERSRIERETRGDARLMSLGQLGMSRPEFFTKEQVRIEAHEAYEAWHDALRSFTGATLGGAGVGLVFAALLWWAAMLSRRTVASGFRGFEPEAEDPLYPKYARLGNLSLAGAMLVLVSGWGGIDDAQPAGIAFALLAL